MRAQDTAVLALRCAQDICGFRGRESQRKGGSRSRAAATRLQVVPDDVGRHDLDARRHHLDVLVDLFDALGECVGLVLGQKSKEGRVSDGERVHLVARSRELGLLLLDVDGRVVERVVLLTEGQEAERLASVTGERVVM